MSEQPRPIQMNPIGTVRRANGSITVQIDAPYRPALKALDTFSHVIVFWWAVLYDEPQYRQALVVPLPYAENREAGVFACRAPVRPNLIMATVCAIESVDEASGEVRVTNIDAFDGTPVVDLKAYYPVTDRVQNAHISGYLEGWPEWFPTEGLGLMEGEGESGS
ncbi:MAG: SAM-dependent methyltransferase [Chloroflexi bacterium]|nr:SAM-dependent methyltransferase [Chloroflexota bacterium]